MIFVSTTSTRLLWMSCQAMFIISTTNRFLSKSCIFLVLQYRHFRQAWLSTGIEGLTSSVSGNWYPSTLTYWSHILHLQAFLMMAWGVKRCGDMWSRRSPNFICLVTHMNPMVSYCVAKRFLWMQHYQAAPILSTHPTTKLITSQFYWPCQYGQMNNSIIYAENKWCIYRKMIGGDDEMHWWWEW